MKIFCFIAVAWLAVAACKDEPPAAHVLDSSADEPSIVQLNGLFAKLIGRPIARKDVRNAAKIGDFTKAELETQTYATQVDNILRSKQFYREGFWHFHEDRLLLAKGTRDHNETSDHLALKLELEDVARSDNYWNILTYRDRWLDMEGLALDDCSFYLDPDYQDTYYRQDCIHFLQAVLHPEIENDRICIEYLDENREWQQKARKFTDIYKARCCPATGESIAAQDTELCSRVNTDYSTLFNGENFCAVAQKTVTDSSCGRRDSYSSEKYKDIGDSGTVSSQLFTWDDNKIYTALSLYISLHLSEEADVFISANVTKPEAGETIYYHDNENDTYLIKATLPAILQGIHASPLWLSTHYTSDNNQHLHRARIIYHSWFCERVSPNQAKKEGGRPPKAEIDTFASYFLPDDEHAKGLSNCFDCHKMIQPLANYFGRMSIGVRYDNMGQLGINAARFLQKETAGSKLPLPTNIKTGYYNLHKGEFFTWGHNQHGMAGLASLLSNLPKVKRCVVKYTWNKIFGCEAELSEKEISDAVNYLPSYRALLTHLLTTEKAKAYFIPEEDNEQWNGEQIFREMVAQERAAQSLSCEQAEEKANAESISGESIVTNVCKRCHAMAINDDEELIFNNSRDHLETIYLRSNSMELGPMMPMGGYRSVAELENSRSLQRKVFRCFIEEKAAAMSVELPALKDTRCTTIDHKTIHRVVP